MVDPRQLSDFSESLGRCMADRRFLDRFYELFIGSSPEVAERFRDTDFVRQKRALSSSLYVMVMAMEGGEAACAYLEQIARRHAKDELDIRPEFYDVWLDCLIAAAREHDPLFSESTEQAWRAVMRFGIEFMQSRY